MTGVGSAAEQSTCDSFALAGNQAGVLIYLTGSFPNLPLI